MYTVIVRLLSETFTIQCDTRYEAQMVITEWQRIGLDAEASLEVK